MELKKKIGLAEGVALVAGGVIGMGIYVMIASIAGKAGLSVWLSISIALAVSLVGVIPLVQISSALPVAGGGYFYCSRLLHPLIGTLVSWWAILGGASSTCVVAVGLGDYFQQFMPQFSKHFIAGMLVALFFVFYLFGLKFAAWLQIVMSAQLVLALIIYVTGIGMKAETIAIGFSLPQGFNGFVMAVALSFNVCIGFQIITEMGEEMRDARRNIPLSLLIGGIFILFVYTGVAIAYLTAVGDRVDEFAAMNAPLIESARAFLPPGAIVFISIGAISAGLTSLNAAAITLPREFYAQARDGVIPAFFGKISARTNNPNRAVVLFFIIVGILLATRQSLDFYGFMAASGVMLLTVFVSIAALRLKSKFPAEYAGAYFKIPSPLLTLLVAAAVISSAGLVALLFMESLTIACVYLVYSIIILLYFLFRRGKIRA